MDPAPAALSDVGPVRDGLERPDRPVSITLAGFGFLEPDGWNIRFVDLEANAYHPRTAHWSDGQITFINVPFADLHKVPALLLQRRIHGHVLYPVWHSRPWFAPLESLVLRYLRIPAGTVLFRPVLTGHQADVGPTRWEVRIGYVDLRKTCS